MGSFKNFAVEIALEAGRFLKGRFDEEHDIHYKGEIDLVTEVDRGCEALLIERIEKAFPGHGILAEETRGEASNREFNWIIDPLDGTTNYAHAYPVFCVSIALQQGGQVILGVICNPMMEELFVAEKGKGAFLNGRRLLVSATVDLSRSLLSTGFPYDIRVNPDNNLNYFNALAVRAQAVRRAGAAALDLAYVAAGRFDGFWELKLHPWDTAAGSLMVTEAGGTVTDLFGGSFDLYSPHVLATNGRIHGAMVEVLRSTDPMDARLVKGPGTRELGTRTKDKG
ncbi:MAG TPA: inositol monophosphatase family protein [Syntrophales bacterium]|nr:inositol monophosphatase family protein [Syntrophales bacterium]